MRRIVVAGCLFVLTGCSPIVDADFSNVEVTCPDIQVVAAPVGGLTAVNFSFNMNSKNLGANSNVTAQNQIKSIQLHEILLDAKDDARGKFTDLSFIHTLHAVAYVPLKTSIETPGGEVVELADYQHNGADKVGAVLSMPPPEPVDLRPLLRPNSTQQAKIVVVVNLTGELPTSNWKVDISMLLSLAVHP